MVNRRYHDGYSNCTDDTFTDCSGVLLASYTQVSLVDHAVDVGSFASQEHVED